MNCNDTQKYIFRFYIKSILNEPNIKNMISFRGVNHTFKYYMEAIQKLDVPSKLNEKLNIYIV